MERLPQWFFSTALLFLGVFYTGIVLAKCYEGFRGDEAGYISMAADLASGKAPHTMWWGPGYPLVLVPYLWLGIPLIWTKLTNVLLLLGTLIYLRSTLRLYLPPRTACAIALMAGIYPPFWFALHMLLTETFAVFLMSGILYHYLRLHVSPNAKTGNLLAASVYVAVLALTKVLYGYVILASLFLSLLLRFTLRLQLQLTLAVLSLSMLWCSPWLLHTYRRSGNLFYWGTSGGTCLYWMSTPFPGETGTWFTQKQVETIPELRANHYEFYRSIVDRSAVERDELFKREAMQNIIKCPLKFLSNCTANVSRMLFDYPYDHTPKKRLLRRLAVIVPNLCLVILFLLSLCFVRGRVLPREVLCALMFGAVAFAASIPLSAYSRTFTVLVPILVVWIACVLLRNKNPRPEGVQLMNGLCRLPTA